MGCRSFDRMPVFHGSAWTETRERRRGEGLPAFPQETLEETAEYRVYRDAAGVLKKEWKGRSGIPQYMGSTVNSAADRDDYKRRLQPDPAVCRPT